MTSDAAKIADALGTLLLRTTRQELHEGITADVHPAVDVVSYPVISAVDRLGPSSAARLGEAIGLERSFVSRLATRLVDADLLARTPDPGDARASLLSLTPDGQRVVATLRRRLREQIDHALVDWSRAERETLADLMGRFALALGEATSDQRRASLRTPG